MADNKTNRSDAGYHRQEEGSGQRGGASAHGFYSEWMNVSGDVDDFIFYDNYTSVSER